MRWLNHPRAAVALVGSALTAAVVVPVAASQGASPATAGHVRLSPAEQHRRLAMRGRRGPRGPRGPAGPQGPQGPQGPTGPDGHGEQIQNVTVNWQNGQWQTNSTAGFLIPRVGLGQIVCTPPHDGVSGTTWLRIYPADPNHYITMWVLRQQDGLPPTVRTAKYYPGAGIQDFNEGFNTVNGGQNTSTGAFQGLISDRGKYGSTGASIPPTSFHLSFTWDFSDPSSARCYVAAKFITGG